VLHDPKIGEGFNQQNGDGTAKNAAPSPFYWTRINFQYWQDKASEEWIESLRMSEFMSEGQRACNKLPEMRDNELVKPCQPRCWRQVYPLGGSRSI
jgi:hypothetical protein